MNAQTFELELVQLEEFFSKSRSNKYADLRKKEFFNELNQVFKAIVTAEYSKFDDKEQADHRQIFNFLLNGLEFLDTSTLNIIPFELVFCLGEALKDWVSPDNLIIVTSLSQRKRDIWFEAFPDEWLDLVKNLILSKYGVTISHRLIRISLPKSLSRDYLSSVVLYHELGHFVDAELNLTDRILFNKYKIPPSLISTKEQYVFYNHQKEYFADLFAAQYVCDASDIYLNHLAFDAGDSETHPSTSKRNRVVRLFLEGKSCEEIDLIQEALVKGGHSKLGPRYSIIPPDTSDFVKLIPQEVDKIENLHGIFKLGWDLWLEAEADFLKDFSRRQRYYIINNLIEKSISNYHVQQNWQAIKEETSIES